MEDIKKYLEPEYNNKINYSDFSENIADDDENIINKIKGFINDNIKDILIIDIQEDKIFLTEKEKAKLPKHIQNMLRYSEYRGIKIYVFVSKQSPEIWKEVTAVFGGSTGRANEYYFQKTLDDPDINSKVKTTKINISELLK